MKPEGIAMIGRTWVDAITSIYLSIFAFLYM